MIALWGGCPDYYIRKLQRLQNEALRIVSQRKWEIYGEKKLSTRKLLQETGQLSINQMISYHTVTTIKKVILQEQPEYLHKKLVQDSISHNYDTRANSGLNLKLKSTKLGIAKKSFRWRAVECYNSLPKNLKEEPLTKITKNMIKQWVMDSIPIHVGGEEKKNKDIC